jgi:hypothetical protein
MNTAIVIDTIHVSQSISNLNIDVNKIESSTGSQFVVFLCENVLYVYGYSPKKVIQCKGQSIVRYISKSEIRILSDEKIIENGIPRSFFSTPSSSWELPKTHIMRLELLTMNGNVTINRIAPQVINQRICPFRLLMRKKACLNTGISVQHLECRVDEGSVINAFKYHDGVTYQWNLESLSLYYGRKCDIKGISVAIRLVIFVIGDVHPSESRANIKIKRECSLVSSDMTILRTLPSFTITREQAGDQKTERVLMKNATEHRKLETRMKQIKESKQSLIEVPSLSNDQMSYYSTPIFYEITYTLPPDASGLSKQETTVTSNVYSVPEGSQVMRIQMVSQEQQHQLPAASFAPVPTKRVVRRTPPPSVATNKSSSSTNSNEVFSDGVDTDENERKDDPIPQDILDESRSLAEAYNELNEQRLDLKQSFELDDSFKKENKPFFELVGNLGMEDVLFIEDPDVKYVTGACLICLINVACTVYSCGHIPTCKACAETQRYLSNTCPVCISEVIIAIVPFI